MLLRVLVLTLVTCTLLIAFFLLTGLSELLDLLFDFEDLAAHNVQFVGLDGHLCFDLLDLLLLRFDLFGELDELVIELLLLHPDVGNALEQVLARHLGEIFLLISLLILAVLSL